MEAGQIVYSKCGRDRGRAFVVLSMEGDYVMLADGKLRKVAQPKKKKHKHIQHTHTVSFEIQRKIREKNALTDADLRKVLKEVVTCQRKM